MKVKNLSVVALSAACLVAHAQTNTTNDQTTMPATRQSETIQPSDMSTSNMHDMKKMVIMSIMEARPADAYYFTSWLNRLPSNTEAVVIKALANNHNAAMMARNQTPSMTGTSNGMTTGTMASSGDGSVRAMSMVMARPAPRFVDYREAYDVLSQGLNPTEQGVLTTVFMPSTVWSSHRWSNVSMFEPEMTRAADILCRMVQLHASMADTPSYRR